MSKAKTSKNTKKSSKVRHSFDYDNYLDEYDFNSSPMELRDEYDQQEMEIACYKGDLDKVERLIKQRGIATFYCVIDNCVYSAHENGHLEIIKLIKKHYPEINIDKI